MSQIALPPSIKERGSCELSSIDKASKKKPSVAIMLPTYCEAGNIESLIREIKSLKPDSLIVVIDDSSHDGTASIVEELKKEYENILVFTRPAKLGLGTAITDGFKVILSLKNPPYYIITMDADYSHNPQAIPKLLATAEKGYDLVIGSRYKEGSRIVGWHILRRLISRVANFIAATMVGMRIRDCTSGFRCYSKNYVKNVIGHLHSQTYEIQIETVKQAWTRGFKVIEIPIVFENRKKGKSKLTKAEFQGFLSYITKTKLGVCTSREKKSESL
ncbi:MAG: polyprenol monophosphomannose synthase [Candidatus Bathyarchaeota archaeon]|nr:polyprenol monophosphomannose synthase [Candidatus Bathyarchaeota archaeon]MDH5494210.1 polyprenol monophosphomannose synthase [Candidatus Bathyarchaeota archaeon]